MKSIIAIIFIVSIHAPVLAKESNFNFYRFNEDWKHLAEKPDRTPYQHIKYVSLRNDNKDWYVSFGGQVRSQFNAMNNDRFNLLGNEDGSLWLNRLTLHSDLHLGQQSRVFIELGSHHAEGSDDIEPGPFDENEINLQQAFIDLRHGVVTLRAGRQESAFGSARLVSVRDGPNVRRAFDGGKIIVDVENVETNVFYLQEVKVKEGAFDDTNNKDEELWGFYTTWGHVNRLTNIDVYYLGSDRATEQYVQGVDRDERHSLGLRFFGTRGAWNWNYEWIYQFGDFGNADVSAWTVATITDYHLKDIPWQPRVRLSANIASGDDDPNDGDLNTFNPLFPNLFYFEEAAILSPQNFMNLQPGITLYPHNDVSVSLDWNFFWKQHKADGVYTAGLFPIKDTANSSSRFVTHVPQLSIDWEINSHMAVDIRYNHFFAGDVIEDAGGDDVGFFMAEVTFNF
ncbi:MAG: alginate export family protein [Pseudomonadota bacterium]